MARPLFDFAAVPWPATADIAFSWGAATAGAGGERLVGAVVAERSGPAVMLHGPVVVSETEPLEIASQLVAAVLDHATAAGVVSSSERGREHGSAASKVPGQDGWRRPLGVLLVEWEFLAQGELDAALAEQRRRPELRLGEILVSLGYLTGPELARALALQHGVYVPEAELDTGLETVIVPAAPGQHVYLVADVVFDPDYRPTSILYSSTNLLEASEFAMEHVDEHEPKALEIQRVSGTRQIAIQRSTIMLAPDETPPE